MTADEMGFLIDQRYGTGLDIGDRIAAIALRYGEKAEPCDYGFFTVRRVGSSKLVMLTDRERTASEDRPRQVDRQRKVGYGISSTATTTDPRRIKMPRGQRAAAAAAPTRGRGRAAAPPAEPETDGPEDYTVYRDKEPTAKMTKFADWIIDNVYEGELVNEDFKTKEDAFREGVRLGGTLRMKFQASPENQADLEAARAAREAEEEPAPAPARGRRGAAAKEEPAAPARRGRGRPAAKAAEPDEDEGDEGEGDEEGQEPETPAPARRRTGRAAAQPAGRAADRPAGRRGGRATAEAPY